MSNLIRSQNGLYKASSASPGGYFPKANPTGSRTSSQYSSHNVAMAAMATSAGPGPMNWGPQEYESSSQTLYKNRNIRNRRQLQDGSDSRVGDRTAQSEPGGEYHVYSAYMNRFAAIDSTSSRITSPPSSSSFLEEKKDDISLRSDERLKRPTPVVYPDPEPILQPDDSEDPSDRTGDDRLPDFEQQPQQLHRGRSKNNNDERSRSMSRTRDLAKRYNVRGADAPIPVPTSPTKPRQPWDERQYRDRVEIVTPPTACVKDLKQKLWGSSSRLQVAVQPNYRPGHRTDQVRSSSREPESSYNRSARSLSPGSSRRQYEQVARYLPFGDNEGTHDSYYDGTTPARTFHMNEQTPSPEHRPNREQFSTRQYFHNNEASRFDDGTAARKTHRNENASILPNFEKETNFLSPGNNHPYEHPTPAASSTESVNSRHSKSSHPHVFKSRFYEAAQRGYSSPARSSSHSTVDRSKASSSQKKKEVADPSVQALVARIGKVNREDPSAALAQIDAILRGEVGASRRQEEPTNDRRAVSAEKEHFNNYDNNTSEVDDDSDDVSTADTSVSSITNPTYQGGKRNSLLPAGSSRLSRPSGLGAYTKPKPNPHIQVDKALDDAEKKKRSKDLDQLPPATIKLSSSKEKDKTGSVETQDSSYRALDKLRPGMLPRSLVPRSDSCSNLTSSHSFYAQVKRIATRMPVRRLVVSFRLRSPAQMNLPKRFDDGTK
jgi:hypothetical protein